MRIASILSIINQGKKKHKIIVDIFSYNIHEGKGAQKVEQYGLYPKLWMKFCKSLQHNKEKKMTPLLWRPPCSLVNNLIFPIFCELSEISLIVQSLLVFEWSKRRETLWTTTRRGRIIKLVVNKESKGGWGFGCPACSPSPSPTRAASPSTASSPPPYPTKKTWSRCLIQFLSWPWPARWISWWGDSSSKNIWFWVLV